MIVKYPKYKNNRILINCTCCNKIFDIPKFKLNEYFNYCSYNCYIKNISKTKEHKLQRHKIHQKKHKYGLTEDQYYKMINDQENKCVICSYEFTNENRYSGSFVDHCHSTGKVRGLLCNRCNKSIGAFEDNISFLKRAIKYLQK